MSNPTHELGFWPLVKQLARLLHSWWRRNAIRVSPEEGRLLRLEPSCYLLIRGQAVQVMGRTVRGNRLVTYHCWTGASVGKLTIERGAATAQWQSQEAVDSVMAAEIEVY